MKFSHKSKQFNINGFSKSDHIYKCIFRTKNFYEIDLLEYIFSLKPFFFHKKDKKLLIDVGANIGNHSIFFGAFVADHLIAIEPNPAVLPTLKKNLSVNIKNYTLYEFAVGEGQGFGAVNLDENMQENIGAARIDTQDTKGSITISTIDNLVSEWKRNNSEAFSVSLIKIDVEGMELQVLKGAKKTILENKPHIVAEASDNQQLDELYTHLKKYGYKKLPGHWATTPVYHFAYNPSYSLYIHSYMMHFRKRINKKLSNAKKLFHIT